MKIFLALLIFFSFNLGFSKVDPPNYNFSLDTLELFKPGSSLTAIQSKYGNGLVMEEERPITVYKFQVSYLRYKFPVFIQVFEGKVLDFYASMPTYFLHDVFHQSLINRFGKQDRYIKEKDEAVYIWREKDGSKHVYSGTCTITCFPIYYTRITNDVPKNLGNYRPLLMKFNK